MTVGEPGTHGATVQGMQGMGVSTPIAAAVAAATSGFAGDMHMAKGMIFAMGAKSMIVAAGISDVVIVGADVAIKVLGAMPKVHMSIAPVHTCTPIELPSRATSSRRPTAIISAGPKRASPRTLNQVLLD
jgi:hypothetical protein